MSEFDELKDYYEFDGYFMGTDKDWSKLAVKMIYELNGRLTKVESLLDHLSGVASINRGDYDE